jgi:ABC-type multidrug transport system ATPase subunit
LTLLVADSISMNFGGQRVLSSARLAVDRGQVVGVLGRMGSGKSTLLKICAGIIRADSGWVEFDDTRYQNPKRSALAKRGLFFLGEADNLAWSMTVREHFDEIVRRFGVAPIDDVLELLDVHPLFDRRVHQLSSGEVRRVEMGLVFARNPSCLLADEIMRSVDPIVCDILGRSLRMLADRGCAVTVTGHEVNYLIPFLDRITWVTSGTTYDLGSRDAALTNEKFAREYLGEKRSIEKFF